MKTKDMCLIALMAALICVAGPMTAPIGMVPLSLATFAVYLSGAVLGAKRGTLAVAVYILVGLVGIPVFSGFSGGVQKVAGVTGGYIIGYLPCALITGLAVCGDASPKWKLPLFMGAGTAVLYAVGTAWFMIQSGSMLGAALSACVIPFLPGDAIKIIAASALAWPIRKAVYQ